MQKIIVGGSGIIPMIDRLIRRLRSGKLLDYRGVARELSRIRYRLTNRSDYNDDGVNIFEEDWDNLIILDACRYDTFAEQSTLPGKLEVRQSKGSMTPEWLQANFSARDLRDTVYVSGNGQFVSHDQFDADLHAFIPAWNDGDLGSSSSVPAPRTVADNARDAADEYPHKRLIVHFVQPHMPYLGPTGEQIDPKLSPSEFPGEIRVSDLSRDTIWKAYRENLHIVLEETEQLLDHLRGKTVVTADHGELIGERLWPLPLSQYGHPGGVYHQALVTVPWLEYTSGERKRIVAEDSEKSGVDAGDKQAVQQHLEDLGYVT